MHCIVTAGPTYEPIDQVRRLTNHSTGQLGTGLAKRLAADGHEVTLLRGRAATHTEMPKGVGLSSSNSSPSRVLSLPCFSGSSWPSATRRKT